MIKANYHTHMKYCNHAEGNIEDYVISAINKGFYELGMSDHAPLLKSFFSESEWKANWCDRNMDLNTFNKYLSEFDECKNKYKDKINLLSALESEFIPTHFGYYHFLRSKVDYLNLGIHYFQDKSGNILNTYFDVNYKNIYDYLNCAILGMKSNLFNTLVHPDLFFYAYKDSNGNKTFDENCIYVSKKICEYAIKYNIYLEVNANGISKNPNIKIEEYKYPVKQFWGIAKNYKDLKIIVGLDAHKPENLSGTHVDKIEEFIDTIGLNISKNNKMEINH